MQSFLSLYNRLVKAGTANKIHSEIDDLNADMDVDAHHLDCLLHPEKHPAVVRLGECSCSVDEKEKCSEMCFFNAIGKDDDGSISISRDQDIADAVDYVLTFVDSGNEGSVCHYLLNDVSWKQD